MLTLSAGRVAHGQESKRADQGEPAGYRAVVDEGLREFSVQNYEEARALFLSAHALYPNARTHRALGLAEFELRNYVESALHFEQALRSTVKPLDDKLREDTQTVLNRTYGFLGRFQVQLRPLTAQLSVDGQRITLAAEAPLLLRIGEHALEASAPGFSTQQQTLAVKGGEELTLTFILTEPAALKVSAQDAGRASDHGSDQRRWYKNPWLWAGVGVVLAGVAGGTAYALTRDPGEPHSYGGTTNAIVPGP